MKSILTKQEINRAKQISNEVTRLLVLLMLKGKEVQHEHENIHELGGKYYYIYKKEDNTDTIRISESSCNIKSQHNCIEIITYNGTVIKLTKIVGCKKHNIGDFEIYEDNLKEQSINNEPAVFNYDTSGKPIGVEYWINNNQLTKEQYHKLMESPLGEILTKTLEKEEMLKLFKNSDNYKRKLNNYNNNDEYDERGRS